jgi:hypothetical protein
MIDTIPFLLFLGEPILLHLLALLGTMIQFWYTDGVPIIRDI